MDGPDAEPQTRAGGLTRAILDTFPVVKFGRGNIAAHQQERQAMYEKPAGDADWVSTRDITTRHKQSRSGDAFEMSSPKAESDDREAAPGLGYADSRRMPSRASSSSHKEGDPTPRRRPSLPPALRSDNGHAKNEPTPEMIGTETCPICILDFEDGDDLRILPCEGKHKFHVDCVDQWLLELSSSCPLCRQGTA